MHTFLPAEMILLSLFTLPRLSLCFFFTFFANLIHLLFEG